jgi:DNA-binding transcriptional ArsR family regulator
MRSANAQLNFVFKAVSDPTRRAILDLLFVSERSVRELTASFSISQPGISQHLRELRKAKLVSARRVHREQRYRLTAEPLGRVYEWSKRYRAFFDPAGHAWAFASGDSAAEAGVTDRLATPTQVTTGARVVAGARLSTGARVGTGPKGPARRGGLDAGVAEASEGGPLPEGSNDSGAPTRGEGAGPSSTEATSLQQERGKTRERR